MKVLVRVSGTERVENKEGIFRFLQIIKKGIIQDQQQDKRNASGKFVSSLAIQEIKKGGQLIGEDYAQQLITGRRPGKFPPIKPILDWIEEKGISPEKISKKSLAFLIARKISKRGTDIFMGLRPALDIETLVEINEPTLRTSFVKAGKIAIMTGIHGAIKSDAKNLRA